MLVIEQFVSFLRSRWYSLAVLLSLLTGSGCTQMIPTQGHGEFRQRNNHPAGINENRDAVPVSKHSMKANEKAIRLILKGKPERAMRALQKIVAQDPTFGPAHNNLGQLYFDQGDYFVASEHFVRAAELMADRAEPLYNLGMVYENTDRLTEAINMYETAREFDPVDPRPLGNLVRVMMTMNPYDLATEPLLKELLVIEYREEWRDWANTLLAHLRSKYRDKESPESDASNEPLLISDEPAMIQEPPTFLHEGLQQEGLQQEEVELLPSLAPAMSR